jgi:hypothetical protein
VGGPGERPPLPRRRTRLRIPGSSARGQLEDRADAASSSAHSRRSGESDTRRVEGGREAVGRGS